jgi:monooxygenase
VLVTLEQFDVVIIGAGLSGVDAAYRLQKSCPNKSYVILEGRRSLGGTWDLFRYPGIRSDSDMFTLGYPFRPWKDAKAIADGPSILRYIEETASEFGIDRLIRFDEKVVAASWSSEDASWTVEVSRPEGTRRYRCNFLWLCSGYYCYETGHKPEFPGSDAFRGTVVHPQEWPADLDYTDKRVVVIGSGATAVTLVPAMAEKAAHVTMVQRSPSYFASLPARDPLAAIVGGRLPERVAHSIVRWKNVLRATAFYQLCRKRPDIARKLLRAGVRQHLPAGYQLDPDFNPRYEPWDQRLCLVPDGDFFAAMRAGKASVVTDVIERFVPSGIRLVSGRELEADIIVTATGLKLVPCGGVRLSADGSDIVPGDTYVYRGFMLSGVPNLAMSVGYTNASWTLRSDLTARSVCRLLRYMDSHAYAKAVPRLAEGDEVEGGPLLNLTSGYVARAAAELPKSGSKQPWHLGQNYVVDLARATFGDLTEHLEFSRLGALRSGPDADTAGDAGIGGAAYPGSGVRTDDRDEDTLLTA